MRLLNPLVPVAEIAFVGSTAAFLHMVKKFTINNFGVV
jgi:hypothetical protein